MVDNQIINESLLLLDVEIHKKEDLIHLFAEKAKESGYVTDANKFYEVVMKREEEVPTAIGYNIAIPHGKNEVVEYPFIAFARTKDLFRWTEGHEETVQLIFQIGVPNGTDKLHLKFISQVSKKLLDEEFRNELTLIQDKQELFELLSSIEV